MVKKKFNSNVVVFAWLAGKTQDVDSKIIDMKAAVIEGNFESGLKECEILPKSGITDTTQLIMIYGYAGNANSGECEHRIFQSYSEYKEKDLQLCRKSLLSVARAGHDPATS